MRIGTEGKGVLAPYIPIHTYIIYMYLCCTCKQNKCGKNRWANYARTVCIKLHDEKYIYI